MITEPWTILSAVAAGVAVPAALAGVVWQVRQARVATGVDILLRLETRFDEPDFREIRRAAAQALIQGPDSRIDDVIDFFETIGLLTRRRILHSEVVWNEFSYWVFGYWLLAENYIRTKRVGDPLRWVEFEWLYKKFFWIEMRKRRHSTHRLIPLSAVKVLFPKTHRRENDALASDLRMSTQALVIEELGPGALITVDTRLGQVPGASDA